MLYQRSGIVSIARLKTSDHRAEAAVLNPPVCLGRHSLCGSRTPPALARGFALPPGFLPVLGKAPSLGDAGSARPAGRGGAGSRIRRKACGVLSHSAGPGGARRPRSSHGSARSEMKPAEGKHT